MSCIITDLVVTLSPVMATVPVKGATVRVYPTQTPIFAEVSSVFREVYDPVETLVTDTSGTWSTTLPWPTEQDPTSSEWVIQLPDGSKWQGHVPEGIAGPLTLHTLKNTYGWSLLSQNLPTGSAIIPVAVQGPPGPAVVMTWTQGVQSFAQIVAQISTLPAGSTALVYLEDGGSGDAFVFDRPANLDRVLFWGLSKYGSMTVRLAAGFVLTGTRLDFHNCYVNSEVTFWNAVDHPSGAFIDWQLDMSIMTLADHAPPAAIIDVGYVVLERTGELVADTQFPSFQGPLIQINNGGSLAIWTYNQSSVQAGCFGLTLGATAASLFIAMDATSAYDTTSYPDHPLPAGISLFLSPQGSAHLGGYTPATDSNWAGSPPTTIGEALDRVAAALSALSHKP